MILSTGFTVTGICFLMVHLFIERFGSLVSLMHTLYAKSHCQAADNSAGRILLRKNAEQPGGTGDAAYRLDRSGIFYVIPILIMFALTTASTVQAQEMDDVIGSWNGGEVKEYVRADSQIVYFRLRPDSSLCMSVIYEIGPRSRFWKVDIDVTYKDGNIWWPYHLGHLNDARDTMWVHKNYKGDTSEWMWVRDKHADPILEKLYALEKKPFEYRIPEKVNDGWECGEPESTGIDRTKIIQFLEEVSQGTFGDFHGLLIVRHNKLVVEEYFAKNGELHGPYVNSVYRDHCHHLASTTKCITSTLMGIAIDKGMISGVREPIITYLPDYAVFLGDGKEDVTIGHLLSMSSGIKRTPTDGRWLWADRDVAEYILDQPLENRPGEHFAYSNGSSVLTGVIMKNALGRRVESFAEEVLFRPLGITEYVWTSYPDGTLETEGGLALRPRDLAKVGQTFLQGGQWKGSQVVPADWVAEATKQRMSYRTRLGEKGYGYFWMQMELPYNNATVSSFSHSGDGGQLLLVIPELDLVIVLTGGRYGGFPSSLYSNAICPYLLPAVNQ